jgi:glutamyl-tRNA synthetase
MRELDLDRYTEAVATELEREGHGDAAADRGRLRAACEIAQEKAQTLTEVWPLIRFLFEAPVDDPSAWQKVMGPEAGPNLDAALQVLRDAEPFDAATLERQLGALVERLGVRAKDVYQPLRVAITGSTVSPGIFVSLAALGREEALARVEAAQARMGASL